MALGCRAASMAQAADYRAPTTQAAYVPLADRAAATPLRPGPLSATLRQAFDVPAFYIRGLSVRGLLVVGSDKVSDYAFLECAYMLDHLLADSPQWVIDDLHRSKVKMGIISVVEYTMDLPENQTEENRAPAAAAFQDRRSRGLGGLPLASCGEENLLNLHGDPYRAEDITIHEFAHTIAFAIQAADPQWYRRLTATYDAAMKAGRFAHSYSATNEQEYWAEGAQAWFDCAAPLKDAKVHSGIWTRAQLKAYDPDLAGLLKQAFGDGDWRYVRADNRPLIADGQTLTRPPADMAHLAGLDRDRFPTFDFAKSPRIRAMPHDPAAKRPAQ
ncbi:MAG: hypothetical protein ACTHLZ_00715 [Tepidisphaeraceae bacterium]